MKPTWENETAAYLSAKDACRFRSPNPVYMKFGNFRAADLLHKTWASAQYTADTPSVP
jgi:hypothetical protein